MKEILLESHNISNLFFGFGQFNYHLIDALSKHEELLKKNGLSLTLLSKNPSQLAQDFSNDFIYKKYHSLQRKPLFRIRKKYDLWHSLNQNTKVEPYHRIPYLLTIHDVNFMEEVTGDDLEKRKQLFIEKLNRSHAITYISNYAKAMTHKYFDVPNVDEFIIYNGSPTNALDIPENYQPKILPKQPYLFSIGEFLEKKNFHTLVEMLVHLPNISLILSGKQTTSYGNTINNLVVSLGLEDRVFVTGKISELDKNYYYKNCLAFTFPSLREGFGIPPIEAMKYGKPVFLSNKSSLPEVGGKHAFYWNHFDPEYMAKIVTDGLDAYSKDQNNYTKNYITHANSYDWQKTALEYISVYNSLLK
ncbi:glycosyltransferase family 1 protein [uncultured Psychroserpens sp.]|uniref:glycosyltransferase family 4 protein n=1 Tax=uncultured Psychroserpens sp. TaxID=255436 RepID=UPI00260D5694|nr:glycosyltransferase family 1 protein [uncultured Psychroserpens sp.]